MPDTPRRQRSTTNGAPRNTPYPPVPEPHGRDPRRRRRDPIWARLLVIFGAFLMLTSGAAVVGSKALIAKYTSSINQESLLGGGAASGKSIDGAINILLVGIDERPDNKEAIRSDSIIILHIPATHDQAYLISIPRDTLVEIPPYPKNHIKGGGKKKINAAFAMGSPDGRNKQQGFELLALTVNKLTGLTFNGGAIVNFDGFKAVVEALGGVDMCIDQRVSSHHIGFDKNGKYLAPYRYDKAGNAYRNPASTPVVYEPGCRRLKPWQALDYVRQRYGLKNGDYDRQRHQQQFVKAIAKEAKAQGADNPAKLGKILDAAGKALTVDRNGIPMEDWLFTLRNVGDKDMIMVKTNGGQVNTVEDPNEGSSELLTRESVEMFEAIKNDKLDVFIATHPNFVSSDS